MQNKIPLVSSKKNNTLYKFNGEVDVDKYEFTNLQTGKKGLLNKEQSKELFNIPIALNELVLEYPNVVKLLEMFNGVLKVEYDGQSKKYQV